MSIKVVFILKHLINYPITLMWRVGSSKKFEVQFAHKFGLEVAYNSIALWYIHFKSMGLISSRSLYSSECVITRVVIFFELPFCG